MFGIVARNPHHHRLRTANPNHPNVVVVVVVRFLGPEMGRQPEEGHVITVHHQPPAAKQRKPDDVADGVVGRCQGEPIYSAIQHKGLIDDDAAIKEAIGRAASQHNGHR